MKVRLRETDIVKLENEGLAIREDVLFLDDEIELAFAKFRFLYLLNDKPGKKIDIETYIEEIKEKELYQRAINELISSKYIEVI